MTKDPTGRFVIVKGLLHSEPITFVNIYGPNIDDPQFFERLFFNLSGVNSDIYISGDWNLILDTRLDRSSEKPSSLTRSAAVVKSEMLGRGLTDVWRELHGNTRGYSFYSPVQNSYTRIDLSEYPYL